MLSSDLAKSSNCPDSPPGFTVTVGTGRGGLALLGAGPAASLDGAPAALAAAGAGCVGLVPAAGVAPAAGVPPCNALASAAWVWGPGIPSACKPFALWNFLIAAW